MSETTAHSNSTCNRLALGALLHGPRWGLSDGSVTIAPGTTLMSPRGHQLLQQYESLCHCHGIDDGDPLDFELAVFLEPPVDDLLHWIDPCSTLRLLCGVIEVMSADVSGLCRVIWSGNRAPDADDTQLLFSYGIQTEFLQRMAVIDDRVADDIAAGWRVLRQLITKQGLPSRLVNALILFSSAAHSPHLDQVCLGLELTLSIVFTATADTGRAEVAHRVSQVLDPSELDGDDVTELVHAVFGVRDELIRNGHADEDRLCEYGPKAFRVTAHALRRVLLDQDLATATNAGVVT